MHSNHPPPSMYDDSEFSHEEYHIKKRSWWVSFLSLISFFITLIFLGFLTYAIFKYNTDAVRDACENLLTFINIRTVIGLIFLASLFTYVFSVHHGDPNHLDSVTYNSSLILGMLVFYFLAFCIAGVFIIPRNMIGNSHCIDALQDSVFKAPILGILGWIYLVCDGLLTLVFIFIWTSRLCRSSSTIANEETEMMLSMDHD